MRRGTNALGLAGLVLASAVLLSACGGGDDPAGPPTATEVVGCIVEAGGKEWPLAPQLPPDFPRGLEFARTVGPGAGHIGVYISTRSRFDRHLASELDQIGEYRAKVALGGRALILLDPSISGRDRQVALDCTEA